MMIHKQKRRAAPLVEALESRWHLAAQQLDGIVAETNSLIVNLNSGVPNVTVFADANANAAFDAGEDFTSTDSTGHFSIQTEVDPQQLRVSDDRYDFNSVGTILASGSPPFYRLSVSRIRPVTGQVYQDKNNNGQPDAGDTFFSGATIFVDQNSNSRFDDGEISTSTDSDGHYSLVTSASLGLVRMITPTGFVQGDTIFFVAGDVRNFRLVPAPSINGTIYSDLNLDGIRESGEPGVSGLQVYLDDNGNGALDGGEATTLTNADGFYSFLAASTGQVGLNAPGWIRLRPTSYVLAIPDHSYTFDIGIYQSTTVTGVVYNDLDRDGVRDAGESGVAGALVQAPLGWTPPISLGGGTISIGGVVGSGGGVVEGPIRQIQQQTAADGSFTLHDMPINFPVLIDGTKFLRTSDSGTGVVQMIGVVPIPPNGSGVAQIRGRVFDDVNNNGVLDPGERTLVNVGVSALAISNGGAVVGQLPGGGATTNSAGEYEISGLANGPFYVQLVQLGPLLDSGLVADYTNLAAFYPGAFPNPGVMLDWQPITISVDPLDIVTRDIPAHPYAIVSGKVVQQLEGQPLQPIPDARVWLDLNNNKKRDKGEATTTTNGTGEYVFDHIAAGRYTVRVDAGPHMRLISKLPQTTVTRDSLARLADVVFDAPTFPVRGHLWLDLNKNGRQDIGERPLRNIAWHLDEDGDGKQDKNERSGRSAADGSFVFYAPYGSSNLVFHVPPRYINRGLVSQNLVVNVTGLKKPHLHFVPS